MSILWKISAFVFLLIGGYYWLVKGQIDYAAFYLALAAINNSNYVDESKVDKAG